MRRRRFLRSAALAAPALWVAPLASRAPRGRVIVAGAGLAGLCAAYDLQRAGFDVTVLEARTRPGGRVYTMREPFADGLYAEAGAARIQDSHAFTMRYVRELGLTLDPFWPPPGSGNSVACVAGRRLVMPQGTPLDLSQLPLPFSDEERALGYRRSLVKYLFSQLPDLGDPAMPEWPSRDLSRFEVSIHEFCRAQGASSAFLKVVALGHDLDGMSALQFLRDAALGMQTKGWFKIRGGNDRLPVALASRLADRIRYGAPVVRLEQDSTSVRVTYRRGTALDTIVGDYLVCAIPSTILRRIEVAPALSAAKRAAVEAVGGLPMARVFLQARRRAWIEDGYTGWASTDDPIDVWDYTRGQPGTRGILGAYTSGRMARTLTAQEPPARGSIVLDMVERIYPGIREHVERTASYSWISDPWALGASAEFGPGQLSRHYQPLRAAEGRMYFAGEQTSPWSGWMNGALESGHRVAAEIAARAD
jgi:monoamine oxidase